MSIYFWSVKILLEYRLIIVEIQILRLLIVFPRQTSIINVKCYISSLLTVKDATLRLLYVELYDY